MIFYRTVIEHMRREDQIVCASCSLRARFMKAIEEGDRDFLFCQSCRERFVLSSDIDEAVRGWVMIFITGNEIPAAVVCARCASDPGLLREWSITRLVLEQSRGPVQ